MVLTTSTWGRPPSRFYRFLDRLEQVPVTEGVLDLAVLGCADGKFVLPAARRELAVAAVDIDAVALFGGVKEVPGGKTHIPGLAGRLRAEGVEGYVSVLHEDFRGVEPVRARGVWTSGCIQYSHNSRSSADDLMARVLEWVGPQGLLYVDYMLPWEEKYRGRPNCPPADWWRGWTRSLTEWRLLLNRVDRPRIEKGHADYPVDHMHQWGHLCLQRLP